MPYRIEYSANNRAACKGAKPCKGTKIKKGEMRLGTLVEIQGNQSFAYRHYGCITSQVIRNIKEKDGITDPVDLDGFEELIPADQAKLRRAFAEGHVAEEDIPDSARVKDDPESVEDADQKEAAEAVLPPSSASAESPTKKKRG
uniref:PARP-type domain-containing protein n=2 Tax=Kalmanozyma brasiliensis (strain GHG001) TaxID=1365824 RepID=V5ET49_KALBG